MTCAEALELLPERIEGPHFALDQHLKQCASCTASFRELRDLIETLPQLGAPPAPEMPDFFARLNQLRKTDRGLLWDRWLRRTQRAVGAAAAVAVLWSGLMLGIRAWSAATLSTDQLLQRSPSYVIAPEVKP